MGKHLDLFKIASPTLGMPVGRAMESFCAHMHPDSRSNCEHLLATGYLTGPEIAVQPEDNKRSKKSKKSKKVKKRKRKNSRTSLPRLPSLRI